MNTAAAKHTIKQCLQALADEQRQDYYWTHDCFTGRKLETPWSLPEREEVDVNMVQKQRDLNCLNEVLCPVPTLGSVLGNQLAALKLTAKVSEAADATVLNKPSRDLLNRIKDWFDLYQTGGLDAVLSVNAAQLSEANLTVIKRALAHNGVLIRNVCMLSAFWIRNPLDWEKAGDTGLLEHLFVEYDTPAFLKTCWSEVVDEESVRWLLCYVMYAQGGSLKALAKHFGWTTQSKKLWHQLYLCPAKFSPLQAVLYAEFKRLGGWEEGFFCLMANEAYVIDLLEPISEAGREFWYDTCRWTISHQYELTIEQHRKVLWWARHQLTECARQGETYRLQGRSKTKVLEGIAAYEQEQFAIQQARARMAERARQVSMARNAERERLRQETLEAQEIRRALRYQHYDDYYESIDVTWRARGWDWSLTAHGKKWRFVELTSTEELGEEGDAMEHCVGGYSYSCVQGEAAIFSLRANGYRTATIEIDPLTKYLVQVQGRCNAEPKRSIQAVVNAWMERIVKGVCMAG